MGVLQLPRLYFNGYNYWTPSTYNNNDYNPPIDTYDAPDARPNWPYLHGQGVYGAGEFKKWSIIPIPHDSPQDRVPPAEWGYYGGQQCGFVTVGAPLIVNPDFSRPQDFTHVTGYTDAQGQYRNPATDPDDPWLNQPLQLNLDVGSDAKLVDINPASFWSSQVFLDSLTLGTPEHGFTAPVTHRMYSRWIVYKYHNYDTTNELIIAGTFSAVFQTCFNKHDIQFRGTGSQLQDQLCRALEDENALGLMLRFTSYDTVYFEGRSFEKIKKNNPGNLYPLMEQIARLYAAYEDQLQDYRAGKTDTPPLRPINSAYSRLVGWIGLHVTDELASIPGGRFLIPFQNPNTELTVQAKGLPDSYYCADEPNTPPRAAVPLGPAAVEVQYDGETVKRLAVDLSTAMPLHDTSGVKADLGTVQLAVVKPEPGKPLDEWSRRVIADLPNDQAAYEQTSGVVDLTPEGLTRADIAQTPLALIVETYDHTSGQQSSVVGLLETPLTAQTDQRGVYADEPAPSWNPDPAMSTSTIQVRYYGERPPEGTTLALAQSDENLNPIPGSDSAPLVALFYKNGDGFQPYKGPIPVQNGAVTIGVQALRPGMPNIAFEPALRGQAYSGAPFNPAGIASAFYTVVRCLPFQNALADAFEAWLATSPDIRQVNERVFREVFGTYHLMYPVMDFINSPLKFQEWRARIAGLTDPALFESARYMPVTRALSAGQRRIIERYCDYLDTVHKSPLAARQVIKQQGHQG